VYSWALLTGDTPTTTDGRAFRQSLGTFPTGVCLATTVSASGKREGMTINSFASVSLDPPLILWSIRDDTRSADAFVSSRHFCISVLTIAQREVALQFARPAADKFSGWEEAFDEGLGGCPLLRDSAANFECNTYSRYQEGDHTILIGQVVHHARSGAAPLVLLMGQMGSVWDLARDTAAAPAS
jgi:flavin reductase (DIM6/NTAB) family NADH-FMN oxidoreductase RutF